MTAPIVQLDDVTASRIAAGEVVERPASVVKELVENSLDAGASQVRVEIREGGRRLIRVVDDGIGIPADEAELAFERHATSKIRSADDLTGVRTLGFRGEALASIAAVSMVTLVSRAQGADTGTEVRIDNGRLVSSRAIGAARGTSVTVENLFQAVPARLAFLRREATESGHVQEIVSRYALAYPDRRFTLMRDDRIALESPGSGALAEALVAVFGLEVAREMLPISHQPQSGTRSQGEAEGHTAMTAEAGTEAQAKTEAQAESQAVSVTGFVSPPHLHRATRKHIALFVNGRWVQDRQLTYAVTQAYHTLLPKGRFPIAVVRVQLPASGVDVNVHPAKTEIRFRDSRPVFSAVQRAVRAGVVGRAPVPAVGDPAGSGGANWTPRAESQFETRYREPGRAAESQATFIPADSPGLPPLRVLGQVARSYIAAEGPDGLYLIDQHAAHERVMYEQFMARDEAVASQQLLAPVAVSLAPEQIAVVGEHREAFAALGFDVEPFGGDAALVRALPVVLTESGVAGGAADDVADTLRTIVDLTAVGESPIDTAVEERLVRAVCKQATVKAGHALSQVEMQELVRRLEVTASPRTCPHGRPTVVVMPTARLEREFGRT